MHSEHIRKTVDPYWIKNVKSSIVSLILPSGYRDSRGRTSLHRALRNSHKVSAKVIQMILDGRPEAVMEEDSRGLYPLHYAIENSFNLSSKADTVS